AISPFAHGMAGSVWLFLQLPGIHLSQGHQPAPVILSKGLAKPCPLLRNHFGELDVVIQDVNPGRPLATPGIRQQTLDLLIGGLGNALIPLSDRKLWSRSSK